jgi:hypothetical protein
MVEMMESIKRARLRRQREMIFVRRRTLLVNVLQDYSRSRPRDGPTPPPADVYEMEEFKTILDDTPWDVNIDKDTFKEALLMLPRFSEQWRFSKGRELLALIDGWERKSGHQDGRRLDMATTYFECWRCTEPISYPRILVHACTYAINLLDEEQDTIHFAALDSVTWNFGGDRIKYHYMASRFAKKIVAACGLDPEEATAQDIDQKCCILECVSCSSGIGSMLVMNWRKAVGTCQFSWVMTHQDSVSQGHP